jgi:DNA-binding FadR family transcriptional regulator
VSADPAARRVSEVVHERLRRQILEGELAPGDPVPSERALADELGVNRHAIREALKRLEQAGLVRISQGGPTRVLAWRESGGLELLFDLLDGASGEPPVVLARAVLEMRASIGVDAARRCAERGPAALREEVRRAAQRTAQAVAEGEAGAVLEAYVTLWRAVVAGSGNLAYELALNSLGAALQAYPELAVSLVPRDEAEVRALGDAVGAGDEAAAAEAARALLEPDVDVLG